MNEVEKELRAMEAAILAAVPKIEAGESYCLPNSAGLYLRAADEIALLEEAFNLACSEAYEGSLPHHIMEAARENLEKGCKRE